MRAKAETASNFQDEKFKQIAPLVANCFAVGSECYETTLVQRILRAGHQGDAVAEPRDDNSPFATICPVPCHAEFGVASGAQLPTTEPATDRAIHHSQHH